MLTRWLIILCFALSVSAYSQSVPPTLSYQGILLQNDGITPLPDGPQTIVFNFYSTAVGGTPVFSRSITVTTFKGLYSCILGDGTAGNAPLPATLGSEQMYIGITVNGGTELMPRAQLTTTPYALMAQSAYAVADNAIGTSNIQDGAVTNDKLATGINASKITTGSLAGNLVASGVSGANINDLSITGAKLADGSITNVNVADDAAIADSKLATLATTGKVSNSATTAASVNNPNAIVSRDGSGNFAAGTITANLVGNVTGNVTGNATTVTTNANLTGDVTSVGNATSIAAGTIVNADINDAAAIADTKLATIATAGKVANSATTATSTNTVNAIVARNASGNFIAGTITANLVGNVTGNVTGNATTVTTNANLTGDVTSVGNITAIATDAVTTDKILDGAVTNDKLAADLSANKIAGGNLSLGSGTITSGNITSSGIISGDGSLLTSLNASNITSGTVNAARLPSSTLTGTGTSGNIPFWTGSTSFGNNVNLFWDNSTNKRLGVGTALPDARLHVIGDGGISGDDDLIVESRGTASPSFQLRKARGTTATPTAVFANDLIGAYNFIGYTGSVNTTTASIRSFAETDLATVQNGNLIFFTNSTGSLLERMRITSAGNVGIGQPSPNVSLAIQNTTSPSINLRRDGSNEWFFTATPVGANRLGFRFGANADANERITFLSTGNVGIGATSPASLLHMDKAGTGNYVRFSEGLTLRGIVGISGGPGDLIGGDVDNQMAIRSESDMLFASGGGQERMRISSGGNVGIGTNTSTPATRLHVVGNGATLRLQGTDHSFIEFYPDGAANPRKGYLGFSAGPDNNIYLHNEISGAHIGLLTTGTTGNVGIGTTSPNAKLSVLGSGATEVQGSAVSTTFLTSAGSLSATSGSQINIASLGAQSTTANDVSLGVHYYRNAAGTDWTTSSLYLSMDVDNTISAGANLVFGSNGNIGIGDLTPDFKLDINGSICYSGAVCGSDFRFKKNISEIENALSKISGLKGVYFDWRHDEFLERNFKKTRDIGFIAQSVQDVLPELVSADQDGFLFLDYEKITAVLTTAIQEQQAQIEELKTANQKLDQRLAQLEGLLGSSTPPASSAKTDKH
jgi:trimeric autotransporter adhesin